MKTLSQRLFAFALLAGAVPAAAQQAAAPAGENAALLASFDDAATKLVQLAEAIPADKYGWKPAEGVRSVAQVLGHVAGGNFFILRSVGAQAPAGLPQNPEALTDKAQLVALVKQSMDFARAALRGAAPADMDKAARLFGQPSTNRAVYLVIVSHAHEHLGQLIAYARSNGVTPPWSMAGGQ